MRPIHLCVLACVLLASAAAATAAFRQEAEDDAFVLVGEGNGGALASVYVDPADFAVVQHAGRLLAEDVERVTGRKPALLDNPDGVEGPVVLVGTLGRSGVIDRLASEGKLDTEGVAGQWESFVIQTVSDPLPGVERALVVAGSDRRGTAYGVFEISEEIGVSPWYWWADVTPDRRESLSVAAGVRKQGPPTVKYRGIFINDEDWGLEPWSRMTFDPEFGDIGPKTYEKVFELLLRLKGNYLWPGMHNCTIEFGAVPGNVEKADEWAIVMGAAHCEPLNRNNVWWHQDGEGEWRYDTNRRAMLAYWEEWARKRGPYEAVWTVGMRGIHDTGMRGPERMEDQVRLLEKAIDDQRQLLSRHVDPDVESVPQVYTPYKEALTHYQNGLRLPDDVTILWCEDNYGYIRQLSDPEEQERSGGSGVYYHISYLGWPRPYLWLNTTPPALIWSEMNKALAYGADRIWVLNVGDIKPGEIGTEFWLRMAWDGDRYGPDAQEVFLGEWAQREFGSAGGETAQAIAALMDDYYELGFQRKPELMAEDIFHPAHYDEGRRRLEASGELRERADALYEKVPANRRDAYYQLVLYPVRIMALVDEAIIKGDLGRLHVAQGRSGASELFDASEEAVRQIEAETNYYNEHLADGKWRHMMTAKGIGGDWNVKWPGRVPASPLDGSGMGVVLEGRAEALIPEAVRRRLEGIMVELAAADAEREPGMELQRDEQRIEHVVVPNKLPLKSGNTLEPGTGAKASFTFDVPEEGHYNLFALINAPTIEDDSWFVKIDDGPWQQWNDNATRGWEWRRQNGYDLKAGRHTLTFANREDGAMLAAVRLTPMNRPQGLGELYADAGPADRLPAISPHGAQRRFIDVYNVGSEPFEFKATASEPWIRLSEAGGTVDDEVRLWVEADWSAIPAGERRSGTITISGADAEQAITVEAFNPGEATLSESGRFVEVNGYISIEAENASRRKAGAQGVEWTDISGLGRTGDAVAPLPAAFESLESAEEISRAAPALEYDLTLLTPGEIEVATYFLPTHRVHEGRGLRYAIAIDDEQPRIVDFYEDGGHGGEQSPQWRENVARNASVTTTKHEVGEAGRHTLRIWAVDPGLVLDKIVIDAGGLKPSYLGPPQTLAGDAAPGAQQAAEGR